MDIVAAAPEYERPIPEQFSEIGIRNGETNHCSHRIRWLLDESVEQQNTLDLTLREWLR